VPGSDVVVVVGEPLSLDAWLQHAPERPHHAFTVELRRLLESVSRTAITAADIAMRDRLMAAAGAAISVNGVPPIVAAGRLHSLWPALMSDPRVAGATDAITDAVARVGGRPVSARDCATVLRAAGGSDRSPPRRSFVGLAAQAPFALVAALLHLPALRFIWWRSRRISHGASDRAARAIVPGFYLMFAWYALLGVLLAAGLAAGGWSWLVIVPVALLFVRLLPRLGDFAIAWWHEWSAHRLARRVSRWPAAEHAALRDSMHTLQAACASHIHGPAVSPLA